LNRNDVLEAQWKQLVTDRKKLRMEIAQKLNVSAINALAVIDVSGSMYTGIPQSKIQPIHVSLSLGLLIACLNDETSPYYKRWITFSSAPKMETLKGEELHEMITNMDHQSWMQNTNLQRVFDLILETGKMFQTPPEKMPKMLIIISDMQFDSCSGKPNQTNWEALEEKYSQHGYTRPTLVFWNVAGNTLDMPVPHSQVPNCCLISGFSPNLLDSLIDGNVPSPLELMLKVINSSRYERITLPEGYLD
jgi:hypothetical protein